MTRYTVMSEFGGRQVAVTVYAARAVDAMLVVEGTGATVLWVERA